MKKDSITAKELAESLALHIKTVTSVKSFDTYNSFFNIFDQYEGPCRKIALITSDKNLEEVYDENPEVPVSSPMVVENNLWLKDFPLTSKAEEVNVDDVMISKEVIDSFITKLPK